MKKIIILLVVVLIIGVSTFVIYNSKSTNNEIDNNSDTKVTTEEYIFENQNGEEVKVEAEKTVTATGFAGASNHVFYTKEGNLYYKNLSNETDELIAKNVSDLYLDGEDVVAVLKNNGKIVKENNYITYKEQ